MFPFSWGYFISKVFQKHGFLHFLKCCFYLKIISFILERKIFLISFDRKKIYNINFPRKIIWKTVESQKGRKNEEIIIFASARFQQPGTYIYEVDVSGSGAISYYNISIEENISSTVRKPRAPNLPAPRLRRQAAFAGGGRGGGESSGKPQYHFAYH